MAVEIVQLDHVPSSYRIYLALFRNVKNAGFLHQQLLARNADFEYAFIDASTIVSRVHLLSAVFKAVNNSVNGTLRTPNVHSEIVVSLSSSSNIADAYRRFGVSPSTSDLFVVKVTFPSDTTPEPPSADSVSQHLKDNVEGDAVPATDETIQTITDVRTVRKSYKLNGLAWLDAIKDELVKRQEMERLILGGMALRGV
ncbi:CGI-121-domain-containing protein [Trichoderma citrinoviride]|uniref:EKC/KEOPS complex subunit CGI121 n=1 Tax=Trichoderma citrinoviride TaxID=58853 RepID=A0A2T4BEM8_9HYPO|nr:CGI-121-domain-containing protein [Trichoderma citrinoviride]PTB67765.1 CGI-121-domain-containing protein [Trichoderma citrinoviride]